MAQAAATKTDYKPARWIRHTPSGEAAPERPRCIVRAVTHEGGDLLYREHDFGTPTMNAWVPPQTRTLALALNPGLGKVYFSGVEGFRDVDVSGIDLSDVDFVQGSGELVQICQVKVALRPKAVLEAAAEDESASMPESALIAREVRELSGLSAEKLGDVFPVERESYQRWMSGKLSPSTANLERLLALRHFLRELAHRVDDPKSWLLAPLADGADGPTAYEVLKRGNLAALWNAIVELPSRARRSVRHIPGEGTVVVVEGSLRGRDYRTTDDELEDYAELLDAGE